MKKAAALLLALAYPFAVFLALSKGFSPKSLSILLILTALFQFNTQKLKSLRNTFLACAVLLVSGIWYFDNEVFLKLYPVLVSLSLLAVFAFSLKSPPSIAERFARLRHTNLPPHAVIYCRRVTFMWCGFFILNASIAFYTIFLSAKVWVLYNGLISYVLIGLLMAGEFAFRLYYMKNKKHDAYNS